MLTGWSYPIKQVSKPLAECKSVRWENMPDWCMIDLPKIIWAKTENYKEDKLYRLIYSDLWGSTYDDGRDVVNGWSPGIDIVTSKWTPVYAISEGIVVQASYKFGVGNSVTIKHKYNGSYIYSSYSHLDEFYVEVGDKIAEWKLIGKVWNTGTTMWQYGNHLDFQITTTTQWFYPYSYFDCNVWLPYNKIVDSVACKSFMIKNTMDPIALLEGNSSIISSVDHDVAPVKNETTIELTNKQSATTVIIKPLVEKSQIFTPVKTNLKTTKKYQYQVVWLTSQENIEIKRKFVFFIKVYDVSSQLLYEGKLANRIVLRDTKWIIAFDNPVVTFVNKGIIQVTALWLKPWYTELKVEIAWRELGTYGITLK